MTEADHFTEIANAILRLRAAFVRAGMEPPIALELKQHEDGDKLRSVAPRDMIVMHPVTGRDPERPDMCVNICGVEVRYPANFRVREKGGFDFE